MKRLLIRADANPEIGTGHVMRCLALGQYWQDAGGEVIVAANQLPPPLKRRISNEGFGFASVTSTAGSEEDVLETSELARRGEAAWIVVDGYRFDSSFQRMLKDRETNVLFIDDYGHCESYCADLVLNQNSHAESIPYANRGTSTRLLLGSRFALLRREFLEWREWREWRRRTPDVAHRILVTLGGSDPDNVTLKVIRALRRIELQDLEVVVLIGVSNPNFQACASAVRHTSFSVELKRNVADMPKLMAWADLAISAAGSTSWEIAFMGLPAVVVTCAEHQTAVAWSLHERGVARYAGESGVVSETGLVVDIEAVLHSQRVRRSMYEASRQLVDGLGAVRVVKEMTRWGSWKSF